MKKIVLTLGLGIASLFAGDMNHSMMDHSKHKMSNSSGAPLMEHKISKEYMVMLSSKKPLVTGNNELVVNISKKDIPFTGEAKLKVFMPEMPGMPYMEFEDKGTVENGQVKFNVNFAMNGTWQYQLKFKDSTGVNSVKGSLNL